MAHQWWYNQVGSDPVNSPWLDEGLAEFATYFYTQKINGPATAERMAKRRWEAAYQFTVERGQDAVVNQPVNAFEANYEPIVYGKAALFHYTLMQAMGEDKYLELLRRYGETYRFKEAGPDEFLRLAEALIAKRDGPWSYFGADTNYPPTKATPDVWKQPEVFEKDKQAFITATDALLAAAKSKDKVQVEKTYDAVHEACKTCHKHIKEC